MTSLPVDDARNGDDRHPALGRARACLRANDPEGALAVLLPALDAGDAPAAALHLWAGIAYAGLGQAEPGRARLLAAAGAEDGLTPGEWLALAQAAAQACDLAEDGPTLDAALQAAVEAAPEEATIYLARGDLYRAMGRIENAINEYDYGAEMDEHLSEAWLALAECELAQGRPLDAADALDHAADLDPNDIGLFARMGDALLEAGDPARAIHAYEEGLELAPEHTALYKGRARAAMAMQLYQDAAEDCRAAVARDEADAEAWLLLGQAYYQIGQDEAAVEALDHGDALRTRADACWSRRDFHAAAADYSRALALAPDDADLCLCLAETRFELGELDEALAGAQAAVAAQPALADAYVLASRVWRRRGDDVAALAALEQGIEAVADAPELYLERAQVYRDMARLNLAWRDLRWAIDLDPDLARAYALRGQLALALESADEALADLDTALEIDPHDGVAYAWRGRAYSLDGAREAAEEDWAEAESLLPPADPLRDQISAWRRERR
jgi:tetratricopeptide (TPR) repeat protein